MSRYLLHPRITREVLVAYFAALGLCIAILIWVFRLWEADLKFPFQYGGDAALMGMLIKGIIDNGWYQINPYLGMPYGQLMYDFPLGNFDFIVIKILSIFSSDYAVVMNLYYLLTFHLTTMTAMYAIRRLGIGAAPAIVGSLLFTFTPYHFLRGENHLLLSAYYMLPLMIMVIMWFYSPPPWPLHLEGGGVKSIMKPSWIAALVICLLTSSTFAYYPFFSCFFLLVAGLTSYLRWGERERAGVALLLILVICTGVLINLAPSIIYDLQNGPNPEVGVRSPMQSEVYGLKIIQLLLPISGHRIPQMAEIADSYAKSMPLVNENSFAALGIVAGGGFLLLILGALFWCAGGRGDHNLLRGLSTLNISAVLLATIGGFGVIFASLITPQIRCYNRISIFIAFFSILALLLVLEILFDRSPSFKGKPARYGLLLLILIVGVLDQSSPAFVPPYCAIKGEFLADEEFIQSVEDVMPEGAMIFQLPYVPFPEHPLVIRIRGYEPIKAYLHSQSLRWSYGAMKGRDADAWQRSVAEKNLVDMTNDLSLAGFQGIYVDGYGYQDGGLAITKELSELLGVQPIVSQGGRKYFFDMREYNKIACPGAS